VSAPALSATSERENQRSRAPGVDGFPVSPLSRRPWTRRRRACQEWLPGSRCSAPVLGFGPVPDPAQHSSHHREIGNLHEQNSAQHQWARPLVEGVHAADQPGSFPGSRTRRQAHVRLGVRHKATAGRCSCLPRTRSAATGAGATVATGRRGCPASPGVSAWRSLGRSCRAGRRRTSRRARRRPGPATARPPRARRGR